MPSRNNFFATLTKKKFKTSLVLLLAMVTLTAGNILSDVKPAEAARQTKITICHRTHSVTNPYRRITVSRNAADGQGNNDHTSHNENLTVNSTNYKVFTPSILSSYVGSNKKWGDIIPPTPSSNPSRPGLNWTEPGAQDIYYGTGNMFGYCKAMSAKQYFDSEVAAGIPVADVLADLNDQDADEDSSITTWTQQSIQNVPDLPTGPQPPSNLSSITQSIAGVIWYDTNRDGLQNNGELRAPGVVVKLIDPSTNQPYVVTPTGRKKTKNKGFFISTVTSYQGQITTDANGEFSFSSVPEGEWTVTSVAPASYEVTYDSEGNPTDGTALATVPAGGAGFAWVGLASVVSPSPSPSPSPSASSSQSSSPSSPNPSPSSGGNNSNPSSNSLSNIGSTPISTTALPNTGQTSTPFVMSFLAFQLITLGSALYWLRKRKGR